MSLRWWKRFDNFFHNLLSIELIRLKTMKPKTIEGKLLVLEKLQNKLFSNRENNRRKKFIKKLKEESREKKIND